ncbi:MAG: hypothetical protein ACI9MC_002105, partial [Kiritimatiellia bacterium]
TESLIKISAMSTGAGSIIEAMRTAYDTYIWLRKDLQRIVGIVMGVVDSMNQIAKGVTSGAADTIEGALGAAVPVAIGLLAQLLHIDGISTAVRGVIKELRGMIDDAFNAVIDTVFGLFTGSKDEEEEEVDVVSIEEALKSQHIPTIKAAVEAYLSLIADGQQVGSDASVADLSPLLKHLIEVAGVEVNTAAGTKNGEVVMGAIQTYADCLAFAQTVDAATHQSGPEPYNAAKVVCESAWNDIAELAESKDVNALLLAFRAPREIWEDLQMLGIDDALVVTLAEPKVQVQKAITQLIDLGKDNPAMLQQLKMAINFATTVGLEASEDQLAATAAVHASAGFVWEGGDYEVYKDARSSANSVMITPQTQALTSWLDSIEEMEDHLLPAGRAAMQLHVSRLRDLCDETRAGDPDSNIIMDSIAARASTLLESSSQHGATWLEQSLTYTQQTHGTSLPVQHRARIEGRWMGAQTVSYFEGFASGEHSSIGSPEVMDRILAAAGAAEDLDDLKGLRKQWRDSPVGKSSVVVAADAAATAEADAVGETFEDLTSRTITSELSDEQEREAYEQAG